MARALLIGLLVVLVIVAIAVPLGMYFSKDTVPCYPEFDGSTQCYSDNLDTWYRWYGPKTDYSISTGLNGTNANEYKIPGCTPVMLYLFSRHSARYPDLADLRKMGDILHEIRNWVMQAADKGEAKLCKKDLAALRKWEQGYHFSDAAQAMQQGYIDVHMIASRLQKMFPTLLPNTYSPDDFKFGISNRERTNQSLQAFAEIIFTASEFKKIQYPPADVKTVSFHKNCERKLWPNHTKPSRELFEEPEAFRHGPVAERYVNNVKARLGLQDKELTYSDLRQVAVECAVSFTAYRESPWCGVLSKEDLLVTEYDDDIYDFYKDTYGRPLNPKMGCPVVNEIVDLFSNAAEKPTEKHFKSVLYFTHSRDYKKLLGSFDLYRGDDPLLAEDFCTDKVRNRKWRDAVMSPYSANIGFLLYNCGGTYKVLTLVNEKPIALPRCSYPTNAGNGHENLCDLREFVSKYRFANCDIDKICTPSAIHESWPDSHWEDK